MLNVDVHAGNDLPLAVIEGVPEVCEVGFYFLDLHTCRNCEYRKVCACRVEDRDCVVWHIGVVPAPMSCDVLFGRQRAGATSHTPRPVDNACVVHQVAAG